MGRNRRTYVVLVDEKNRKRGVMEKEEAHRKGELHRAFSVLIFNSRGEMLIQRRALSKYHSPGLWSNAVCSHPFPGEKAKMGAERRLKEEMGFTCKLKKLFCFVYKAKLGELWEHEYDCVFSGTYDGDVKPNPEEVMDYKWVSIEELKKDMKNNKDNYTVWFRIIIKEMERRKLF